MLQPFLKGDVDDPDLRLLLADIYRAREEFEKSIEQLDRLVEVNPKSPLYLYKRGLVYFDWKNLETARKQFLKAYALDPNFVDAYFYVGRVDFERKDYPQAIKAFRASLDEQPSNGDYRFYMAFALERSGNLTQALEEYTALDRFSSDYAKRNPEVYYRRGRIMALQGNYRKAKQDLGKILERDNEHFGALVALADTFFDERKYKQAVELYDRALEQNDQVAYVHYRLGLAYRFLKKRSEALRSLQEAIDLGIKDPKVHRIMGFDYRDIGQSGKAVGSFKAYLAQRPDASDKKEIEKQIRRLGGSL
jgi:tetratricopeptide (TPR) repeat protein